MYNRIYKLFNKNNVIYPLDLMKILEKCRERKCWSWSFDTVEHDILLAKLEHYSIRGMANYWFKSISSIEKNLFQ